MDTKQVARIMSDYEDSRVMADRIFEVDIAGARRRHIESLVAAEARRLTELTALQMEEIKAAVRPDAD